MVISYKPLIYLQATVPLAVIAENINALPGIYVLTGCILSDND